MTTVKLIRGEQEGEDLSNYLAQYRVADSVLSELVFEGLRIYHYKQSTVVMVEKGSEENHYLYVHADDRKHQEEVFNELERIAFSSRTSE